MNAKDALAKNMAAKKPSPKPTPKGKTPLKLIAPNVFNKDISKIPVGSKEWYKAANTKGVD